MSNPLTERMAVLDERGRSQRLDSVIAMLDQVWIETDITKKSPVVPDAIYRELANTVIVPATHNARPRRTK